MRRYGTVKWFGGINKQTGKENKFGFITDISGKDIYLSINDWKQEQKPAEGQILSYDYIEGSGGKAKALDAIPINKNEPASKEEFASLMELCVALHVDLTKRNGLEQSLVNRARTYFATASVDEIYNWLLALCGQVNVSSVLYEWNCFEEFLNQAIERFGAQVFEHIPIERLSTQFIISHEEQLASYLVAKDKGALLKIITSSGGRITVSLILYLVAQGVLENESEVGIYKKELGQYMTSMVSKNVANYPAYVSKFIEDQVKPKGGLRTVSLLRPIIEKALYKRYLYNKNVKAIDLFNQSRILQDIPEYMVLNALFEPILAGNDLDVIYAAFFDKLWSLIIAKRLIPGEGLETLFPGCGAMPKGLACEAVYWENQEIYLCRGAVCSRPAVIPNLSKDVSEYSIYDWFAHFEIKYSSDDHPSRKDFPIKIAGYFNRLVEIYPRIHCRTCGQLMVPDFKYARVQRVVYENGVKKVENLAAAYRCTVFKCKTDGCFEFGKGNYINHCIGYLCSNIIDSRDCLAKCASGRFICNKCGSCCSECAKNNPDGFCPKCAAPLVIYENVGSHSRKFKNRFVQCSSSTCDFYIPSENLSQKFYLKTCSPPRRVESPGPVRF